MPTAFDFKSLHEGFIALTGIHPGDEEPIKMARANLAGAVRGISKPNDAATAAKAITDAASGNTFVGECTHLMHVQIIPQRGEVDRHMHAIVAGRRGLGVDDAYVLGAGISDYLKKNGHQFNPDTWRLMSADTLQDVVGAVNGNLMRIMLEHPCPEPNLLAAIHSGQPATEDLREPCMLRFSTPSMTDLTWLLVEVQPVYELGLAFQPHGAVWINPAALKELATKRRAARQTTMAPKFAGALAGSGIASRGQIAPQTMPDMRRLLDEYMKGNVTHDQVQDFARQMQRLHGMPDVPEGNKAISQSSKSMRDTIMGIAPMWPPKFFTGGDNS